jgi:hypothetical protein
MTGWRGLGLIEKDRTRLSTSIKQRKADLPHCGVFMTLSGHCT